MSRKAFSFSFQKSDRVQTSDDGQCSIQSSSGTEISHLIHPFQVLLTHHTPVLALPSRIRAVAVKDLKGSAHLRRGIAFGRSFNDVVEEELALYGAEGHQGQFTIPRGASPPVDAPCKT